MNAIMKSAPPLPVLSPTNFAELERFATIAAKSEFVPKEFRGRPADVMLAVQMGSELGLAPLQSLQNVAVINGKPSIYGDAMLAVCSASPLCSDISETFEGEGEELAAVCVAQRKGRKPVTARFSVADARRAALWDKAGPWKQYPRRMLQMRARGFALRDAFPDVLRGLIAREEAEDYPGKTIEAVAEPVVAAALPVDNSGNADAVTQPYPDEEAMLKSARWVQARCARLMSALNVSDLTAVTHKYAADIERLRGIYPTLAAQYDAATDAAWKRLADPVEEIAERGADLLSGG